MIVFPILSSSLWFCFTFRTDLAKRQCFSLFSPLTFRSKHIGFFEQCLEHVHFIFPERRTLKGRKEGKKERNNRVKTEKIEVGYMDCKDRRNAKYKDRKSKSTKNKIRT